MKILNIIFFICIYPVLIFARGGEVSNISGFSRSLYLIPVLFILALVFTLIILYFSYKSKVRKTTDKQAEDLNSLRGELEKLNAILIKTHLEAESHVQERTAELKRINELLHEEIEERKQAEQSLNGVREYLLDLLNSVADPIFVKDNEHRWILLNDACLRIIGLKREELIGKSDYDVFPEEEAKVFWEKDDEVLRTGIENINEERITTWQGETHIIETKKKLYLNKKNERFIVGIISDITEQRTLQQQIIDLNQSLENKILERTHQLQVTISELQSEIEKRKAIETELIQQKEKAEESSRLKTNFLSNMSHEIRTPLTGILGYAELLEEELGDDPGKNMAKKIIISGKRLLSTLDAVMLLSRLQSGQITPVITEFDIQSLIKTVISKSRAKAVEKNLIINYFSQETKNLKSDRLLLSEVITQLLDNALKFTPEGEIQISNTNRTDCNVQGCLITIKDPGIGIKEDQLEFIFSDFRQVSEGWGRSFEGNGVGLSISKRIVELLKGRIWAEHNEIKGSTFHVWIPFTITLAHDTIT